MANPIKIVADVTFDDRQIQQAGQQVAKPALSRLADGLAKGARPFKLLITADASNAEQLVEQFASQVDTSMSHADSRVQAFGKTLAGIGVGGLGVGALLTSIGSGEQQAQQQLDAAIEAAGQSVDEFSGRIESAQSTEEGYAHTHEDTDAALQKLVQSYGDTGAALDRLDLVTNLAAANHISLADAASLVARVHGGATRALKPFNIQVKENADGTKDLEGALDELSKKVAGQADASINTFTGHLKVLGTEIKDQVATFGQQYGPLILGVSTGLTALGGVTSAAASAASRLRSSSTEAAGAVEALTVAQGEEDATLFEGLTAKAAAAGENTLFAASEAETAAAIAASNEELALQTIAFAFANPATAEYISLQEALALSEGAVVTNSAAEVASLYEVEAAEEAATIGLGALAAGAAVFIAAGYGIGHVLDDLTNPDGWDKLSDESKAAGDAVRAAFADASNVNPQSILDSLTGLVRGNEDYAKALVDSKTNTHEFTNALLAGGGAFATYLDRLRNGKDVTDADRLALGSLGVAINDQAQHSLNAAVANKQLDQATLDAAASGHKFTDGSTDWVAALSDLAGQGKISKQVLDDVADSAGKAPPSLLALSQNLAHLDPTTAKKVDEELKKIRADADTAAQAALALAPADIRAQQGQLTIADDQARVKEAQDKLAFLRASPLEQGESEADRIAAIAAANRDLERAQLDLQQATLDEANAQAELHKQQILANNGTEQQTQYNDDVIGSLQRLNEELTGPAHDAINQRIWDLTIARDRTNELTIAALGLAGVPQPGPYYQPERPGGGTTGLRANAAGGWNPPNVPFIAAEQDQWELGLMPKAGVYQAPPSGMFVIPHDQSVGMLSGLGGGSNRPAYQIGQVTVVAPDAVAGVNRLPDAIREDVHLRGG